MDQKIRKDLASQASGCFGIKAAVIVPSVCDFYFTPHRFSNLGAKIVCSILTECGIENVFFNFPLAKNKPQIIDIPKDISYLTGHIVNNETGKLSYFTRYQRFGPDSSECATLVTDLLPSICFISCFAYSYAQEVFDLSKHIKKIKPDLPIVVGGAGVSAYPLYFIRDRHIDFAIAGEAEISLRPFCNAMFENGLEFASVPNLYRKPVDPVQMGTLRYTNNDEIMPAMVKVQENKKLASYSVSIARGCESRCKFCSNFLCHGHGFRMASFEALAKMLNSLSFDRKDRILVNFEDDNLLYAPEIFLQVMRMFREKSGAISFLAENGLDYNKLTISLADQLIEAGMQKFNFTLGSINKKVLEAQARKGSQTHFESIVRHIASRGLPVLSYFICGLRGDSKESVANVLAYLFSLPTQAGISMFYAIPGLPDFSNLEIFDNCSPNLCKGTSAYQWYTETGLQTDELVTAFRLTRYVNLLKSEIKSEFEEQLIEKVQKERKLFTLIKKNKSFEIIPVPNADDELVAMLLDRITSPFENEIHCAHKA
jgi:anaerobic magnesium-protoporphyrin IX monomethyl ester cyclase